MTEARLSVEIQTTKDDRPTALCRLGFALFNAFLHTMYRVSRDSFLVIHRHSLGAHLLFCAVVAKLADEGQRRAVSASTVGATSTSGTVWPMIGFRSLAWQPLGGPNMHRCGASGTASVCLINPSGTSRKWCCQGRICPRPARRTLSPWCVSK